MSLLLHFDIEYLKGDTDHSFIEITVDENTIIYLNCIPVVIIRLYLTIFQLDGVYSYACIYYLLI